MKNLVPVMNFGATAAVCAAEADAKAIRNGWPPGSFSPQTRVAFHLQLQAVLDFTNAAAIRALGIKKTELMGCDWEAEQTAGREALTQALARAAFETYAEGLIVPSARLKGGRQRRGLSGPFNARLNHHRPGRNEHPVCARPITVIVHAEELLSEARATEKQHE